MQTNEINMAKNTKSIVRTIQENPTPYIFQVLAVLITLLNLWVASKLAPVTQDLAVVTTRVQALETNGDKFILRSEVEAELKNIDRRLQNMERHFGIIIPD